MADTDTTCKNCKRAVYTKDVDAKGLCCFCVPPKKIATEGEKS